jgi:anti-sigma regulatory factor (Ser/Thr protein kinase)
MHLVEQATRAGLDQEAVGELRLALEELMVNICHHAYPQAGGVIEVRWDVRDHVFYVELRDNGTPFDPTVWQAENVDVPLEQRAAGGMGIALARGVLDAFTYRRDDDINVTRVGKRIHAQEDTV